MTESVTVIVPIHNALDDVDACLAALDRTLVRGSPVLLADDASSDPRVARLLADWCARTHLAPRYVRRERNLGFPENCNHAFAETGDDDIVLLNSDALVSPGWLTQIARCATSDARIATITPWSNNAEICSWPRFIANNPLPDAFELDAIAEAAAAQTPLDYPELPTAVGFCMYLRRAALRQLGDFDSATFGTGYGEENDWCLRASAMGWRHVLCDGAFVAHRGGASFAPLGQAPGGENLDRLNARWPGYNERIARFIMADPLQLPRARLSAAVAAVHRAGPQRDLFGSALPSLESPS